MLFGQPPMEGTSAPGCSHELGGCATSTNAGGENGVFLLVSRRDQKSLSKISPFVIEKELNVFGEVTEIIRRADGKILIEAINRNQAEQLATLTSLSGHEVLITMDIPMNTSKAIVRDEDMIYWSEKEMLENLASQGVIAIKNIKSRRRIARGGIPLEGDKESESGWYPTPLFIVTFNLPSRPQFLKVGYVTLETRDYIPDPIRCFQCQQFGHFRTSCKNAAICVRCSEAEHRPNPCKSGIRCSNCGGPHFASWRICPVYKEQYEIQKVAVSFRVPLVTAKRIFKNYSGKHLTMVEEIARGMNPSTESVGGSCQCTCTCSRCKPERMLQSFVPSSAVDSLTEESNACLDANAESTSSVIPAPISNLGWTISNLDVDRNCLTMEEDQRMEESQTSTAREEGSEQSARTRSKNSKRKARKVIHSRSGKSLRLEKVPGVRSNRPESTQDHRYSKSEAADTVGIK